MRFKSSAEVFRIQGDKTIAVWARPERASPRFPAVLFLHGYPGSEKSVDVQRALNKKGVATLALHFRGAWGSEGVYRFSNLIGDARAAWRFLKTRPGVDRRRLAVFGFSMGGWTAIHLSARERDCRAVVAVAPVGGPEMDRPGTNDVIRRLAKPIRTAPLARHCREFIAAVRRWDPAESAAQRSCPLLIVHGTLDDVVPLPVGRRIYAAAAEPRTFVVERGAYHDFLDRREKLARTVSRWLVPRLS